MAHILVVDDDPIVIQLLTKALQEERHSTQSATDAFDALEKIKQETFHLVICDVGLPGHNGFDLVATIRADEQLSPIPVLFLTGRRGKRDVMRAIEAGGDDYMLKPVDFKLFFAKVEALLNGRQQTHAFAETPVSETATWSTTFEVVGVSEQGLSFRSEFALPVNMKFKFDCAIFQEIGIVPPTLRVAVCNKQRDIFRIKMAFVGLTPQELQQIRVWTNSNQPRKAQNAS